MSAEAADWLTTHTALIYRRDRADWPASTGRLAWELLLSGRPPSEIVEAIGTYAHRVGDMGLLRLTVSVLCTPRPARTLIDQAELCLVSDEALAWLWAEVSALEILSLTEPTQLAMALALLARADCPAEIVTVIGCWAIATGSSDATIALAERIVCRAPLA